VRKKTSQTLTLLNNVNSNMAQRDMTDVATVVMKTDRGHVVGVD